MRTATTGATRDDNNGKFDYFKFFSVVALNAYVAYMYEKRTQPDGALRSADNWQKGMPRHWYSESAERHLLDVVYHTKGYPELAEEDLVTALCALLFNTQAYLHEVLIERSVEELSE